MVAAAPVAAAAAAAVLIPWYVRIRVTYTGNNCASSAAEYSSKSNGQPHVPPNESAVTVDSVATSTAGVARQDDDEVIETLGL